MSEENKQPISLESLMEDRFARYAKYIILDRALPDVKDGLKPVQRRILYAMYQDGNLASNPYRKSAKTVGLVIGNYHPHGDSSVYDAMVRMSQWWKNNHPLIDMQGNNGSLDDDPAAAMRYTEARLSVYAQQLCQFLDEQTVDFISNFDDTTIEPVILPAIIPNLLINGATGIAAGYATNIPPHNLNEIIDALIFKLQQPTMTLQDLKMIVKGPDFPTGGVILGQDQIDAYLKTGKGRLMIRAKIEHQLKKTTPQLVITEIPYEVIKANLVKKIDDLRVNKTVDGIIDVRDESDRNGLKIVIDLSKDADPGLIENVLYKHTDAQIYYNVNLVAIDQRAPALMGLLDVLESMIQHYQTVYTRVFTSRIEQLSKRMHLVSGLIKAVSVLDEIIALIRQSTDKASSKVAIMEAFDFTEAQAEAIVSLRLYRLSATDIVALKEEFAIGVNQIEYYQSVLDNQTLLNTVIGNDLKSAKETFHTVRKSTIIDEVMPITIDKTQMIQNETVLITVSQDGYIKKVSMRSMQASGGDFGLKESDVPIGSLICESLDTLLLISTSGHYAYIPVYEIEEAKFKEVGQHFSTLVKHSGSFKVIKALIVKDFQTSVEVLMVSQKGFIKQTPISQFELTRYNKTSVAMSLLHHDHLVYVACIHQPTFIALLSSDGYLAKIDAAQVPVVTNKAKGVKAMNLSPQAQLVDATLINDHDEFVVIVAAFGQAKRIRLETLKSGNRPYKGELVAKRVKSNPVTCLACYAGSVTDSFDIFTTQSEVINFKDIPIMSKEATYSSIAALSSSFSFIKGLEEVLILDQPVIQPKTKSTDLISDKTEDKEETVLLDEPEETDQNESDSKHFENLQFDIN